MRGWDLSDPFDAYRRLEGQLTVDFVGEEIPLILRHADVRDAAMDWQRFSSDAPFRVPIPPEDGVRRVRQIPIELDPPKSQGFKELLRDTFGAPRKPEYADRIKALVERSIAQILDAGPFNVVDEFALPLQGKALTQLLRMPESEADVWQAWGTSVFHDDTGYSEHKGQGLEAYILDQLEQTRDEPGADFFSWLNTVEHEGCKLTEDEKLGIALLVFAGGRDTIISMVSFCFVYFANHPQSLVDIRENPALERTALEEFVRIVSPLSHIGRVCPHATEVHGVSREEGERVSICWASANRDDAIFTDPHTIDIARQRNAHMGFGYGPHMCLGSIHARVLLRSVIAAMAAQIGEITLHESIPKWEDWKTYRRQIGCERLIVSVQSR